jgi:Phage Terminase
MSEQAFRRARLCQHVVGNDEPVLPAGVFESLSTGAGIPDGAEVVLSFDGSYSGTDCTVILAATISPTPHMDIVGVWQRPEYAQTDWRAPILEAEQAIRDACKRWRLLEITADPYRWQRSLEVLKGEGPPCAEFPQSPSRMCAATADFLTACVDDKLTHSGNTTLAVHLANAVLQEDNRGARMVKATRSRHAGQIDAAICAVMGHSRATWLAMNRPKRKRYASSASARLLTNTAGVESESRDRSRRSTPAAFAGLSPRNTFWTATWSEHSKRLSRQRWTSDLFL